MFHIKIIIKERYLSNTTLYNSVFNSVRLCEIYFYFITEFIRVDTEFHRV
jgi:hypothetical protein